eukprot:8088389-Pyramimonas_sp.AAC.1
MPFHLSIKYDNTGREGKNQHFLMYLAWLQASGKFQSVQGGQGQKGHTHDGLDQRFAVITTILQRSTTLETPVAFVKKIRDHFEAARGRELIVQEYSGAWDWQSFFTPLGINISGVAATHWTPDVCHCKRLVSRRDLPQMDLPGWESSTPD